MIGNTLINLLKHVHEHPQKFILYRGKHTVVSTIKTPSFVLLSLYLAM